MGTGYVLTDSGGFASPAVTSGITASTSQSQGNGILTSSVNEISTVTNGNDTVTLPIAVAGREIMIVNNGANTLQIFPASGDSIGNGVDARVTLQANGSINFVAYDSTNWKRGVDTEIIHAQMYDFDNTDAFVISAQSQHHLYHTNGMTGGKLAGWTFDAGGAGTSIAISSIADGGGGDIAVTTGLVHGLAVDDVVSISNTGDSNYDKNFVVKSITSSTIFEVTATFGATATGTVDQAATLTADTGSAGRYLIQWTASATSAANNETFDFAIHIGAAHQDSTNIRRKFGVAGDVGAMSGVSILTIANDDKISFMVLNTNSAANITIRNFSLVLIRL